MITTTLNQKGNVKTTTDDMNPRIYHVEVKCKKCKSWFSTDEIYWIGEEEEEAMCVDCFSGSKKRNKVTT